METDETAQSKPTSGVGDTTLNEFDLREVLETAINSSIVMMSRQLTIKNHKVTPSVKRFFTKSTQYLLFIHSYIPCTIHRKDIMREVPGPACRANPVDDVDDWWLFLISRMCL